MNAGLGAARLWAGKSVFGATSPQDGSQDPLHFAIVAAGPGAGAGAGPPAGALPARVMFGVAGLPALRTPLILDATFLERASPKTWAACARGCSAAGAALQVSAPQLSERREMLRASGVPLVLLATPGQPLTPETCADAALIVVALAARSGAPAVLDEAALPSLVEAVRGTTLYKVPAAVLAPPGRLPAAATLQKLNAARAVAVGLSEGTDSTKLPLAALLGLSGAVAASDKVPPTYLSTDAASDGVSLACALAGGSGVVATSLPLRLAAAEEAAMDADWKAVGDQLANALRVMWTDAQRASGAAGVRDPRDLTRDNLRALTFDAAALSGARLAGFDERLPWWVH